MWRRKLNFNKAFGLLKNPSPIVLEEGFSRLAEAKPRGKPRCVLDRNIGTEVTSEPVPRNGTLGIVIDPDLHARIKAAAAMAHRTMQEYVSELLERALPAAFRKVKRGAKQEQK